VKASIIHVTEHAMMRWAERVSGPKRFCVYDIIDQIKQARIIKKNEALPFQTPRLKNTLYAYNNGVLFILEAMSIIEFNLITIITQQNPFGRVAKAPPKQKVRFVPETKKKKKKRPARNKKVEIEFD